MARRKTATKNESHTENCITNEISAQKRAAINNANKRKAFDQAKRDAGYKEVWVKHPTTYRALMQTWVKA